MRSCLLWLSTLAALHTVAQAQLGFNVDPNVVAGGLAALGLAAVTVGATAAVAAGIADLARKKQSYNRNHYYRRWRRAISDDDFIYIEKLDLDRCVIKLVCELGTRPLDSLGDEERMIVELFRDVTGARSDQTQTAWAIYHRAASLGAAKKDVTLCRRMAPQCQHTVDDLMNLYKIFV